MGAHIFNFLTGSTSTFLLADQINPTDFSSWEDVLKYLISILGGILASIVIKFLKSSFPNLFKKGKK